MMQERTGVYVSGGVVAALALGMALTPFRGTTSASNLAFAFMGLVIVVAELGGRGAAVVTALVSAASLDFFLTEPYLRLTIAKTDDVIAFFGLAVCGLIAAAFGTRREAEAVARGRAGGRLGILRRALHALESEGPLEQTLRAILADARVELSLAGLVVRNVRDEIVAASDAESADRPRPTAPLDPGGLLAVDGVHAVGERGLRLPPDGGRLPLRAGARQFGWLDVWGDPEGIAPEDRATLADLGRLLALLLAGRA